MLQVYLNMPVWTQKPMRIIKDSEYCPFDWWSRNVRLCPLLVDLGALAVKRLSYPSNSSFSEFIFSYGGFISGKKRSSLSVERINTRELVKFNSPLFDEVDKTRLTKVIENVADENSSYGFPVEVCEGQSGDIENTSTKVDALIKELTCIYCSNEVLKKSKVTSRIAGRVMCDAKRQPCLVHKFVQEGSFFYGCENCLEYDICEECYGYDMDHLASG